MLPGFGGAAGNILLSRGRRVVGRATRAHPFPGSGWAVGRCGGFAVFVWSIAVQVGGFHPSTASYSPGELTVQIDPAPCRVTRGVSVLPSQSIRAGDQPTLPIGTR